MLDFENIIFAMPCPLFAGCYFPWCQGHCFMCVCMCVCLSVCCMFCRNALIWKLWGCWCPNWFSNYFGTAVCCQACCQEGGQHVELICWACLSCWNQYVLVLWSCNCYCFWIRNRLRNLLLLCFRLLVRPLIMNACFVNVLCKLVF